MIRYVAATLAVCILATPLAGQTPAPPSPENLMRRWEMLQLRRTVLLERPTIVILVHSPEGYEEFLTREQVAGVRRTADSVRARLEATAKRRGYGFEVRITGYEGIRDRAHNALYTASLIDHSALIIARPGFAPRLTRMWLEPGELSDLLDDYHRLFRPLLPAS
jgi:hypothetical protein